MRLWTILTCAALAMVSLTGCGSGGSTITGEVMNNPNKPKPGEKWSLTLTAADGKGYSGDTDEKGAFKFEKVPSGSYTVQVTHYIPVEGNKASPRPQSLDYPERWEVPGGPYKLDLSKLPKPAKK